MRSATLSRCPSYILAWIIVSTWVTASLTNVRIKERNYVCYRRRKSIVLNQHLLESNLQGQKVCTNRQNFWVHILYAILYCSAQSYRDVLYVALQLVECRQYRFSELFSCLSSSLLWVLSHFLWVACRYFDRHDLRSVFYIKKNEIAFRAADLFVVRPAMSLVCRMSKIASDHGP